MKVPRILNGTETTDYYYTYERTRDRECNTFDDQCLTEPGLKRSFKEAETCGNITY